MRPAGVGIPPSLSSQLNIPISASPILTVAIRETFESAATSDPADGRSIGARCRFVGRSRGTPFSSIPATAREEPLLQTDKLPD